MSRRAFGGWASKLDQDDFARALAALGVLTPVLEGRGELGVLVAERSADYYVDLLKEFVLPEDIAKASPPLHWEISALGSDPRARSRVLDRLPAAALAAAWSHTVAQYWRLEVVPVEWLDLAWTLQTLSEAVVDKPFVNLPEPASRATWHWPLHVGFLPDPASRRLREDLYADLPDYLANLTEAEIGASAYDVLLIPQSVTSAIEMVERSSLTPDATAVVVVGSRSRAQGLQLAPELAARLHAWAVAAVQPGVSPADWYQGFLADLSHANRFIESLSEPNATVTVFAAEALVEATPVVDAARALSGQMRAMGETMGDRELELPPDTADALNLAAEPPTVGSVGWHLSETELAFDHERHGATHVATVGRAAKPVLEEADREQADKRFILAEVYDASGQKPRRVRGGFRSGKTHEIDVWIGPKKKDDAALAGEDPFPEGELPRFDAGGHELTVVLAEPALLPEPLVGTIKLKSFGPSAHKIFTVRVGRDVSAVEARITVLYRGRILQTAVLQGQVLQDEELENRAAPDDGPAIRVWTEAVLRRGLADLDRRQRFQGALVLNHDRDGSATATVIGDKKAAMLQANWVEHALDEIGEVFKQAEQDRAFGRSLGSATSLRYMSRLANAGVGLNGVVGKAIEEAFGESGSIERIQVLSANANTFMPIELIYDFPPPAAEAGLCPNWKKAIRDGRCDPDAFHHEDVEGHLDVICPAGFWAISKVIERQAVSPSDWAKDPETRGLDFAALSEPVGERNVLSGLTPALFAASDHVNDVRPTELDRVTRALQRLTSRKLDGVNTWKDWAVQVKESEPPLLLLLAHTELNTNDGAALEIASKERRVVAQITKNYVNMNGQRPGPIVMLLGCDTGVPKTDFQSFVVKFKDMGAALVVGTIAPVLGRHASRTAEALVEQLLKMTAASPGAEQGNTFGDAMLAIRRELLRKGVLMSLCLTAYGDADWRLPAGS
jgi:hypothetical protein